jgi:hypothetical protein
MPASTERFAVTKDLHAQIAKVVAQVSDLLRARDIIIINGMQQHAVHHATMKRSHGQESSSRKNSMLVDNLKRNFAY